MIKNYISALLVMLLAGAQMLQAQESMEDVFAQLDAVNEAGGLPPAPPAVDPAGEEAQDPLALAESKTLGLLFEKGLAQYKEGRYDEAIMTFDAMLGIDKYDSRAMAYRKRASLRIASKETKKQRASRANAMADVNAAWSPDPKVLVSADILESVTSLDPDHVAIQQMEDRLKAITIPTLDFQDSSIEDVVLFLAEASRRQSGTGEDVDFLVVGMEFARGDSNVTLSIADMSLYEALQFIVEMTALKFEIKPTVVAIMPVNYVPLSEMIMSSYDIIPEVGADLETVSSDAGGGVDDLFGDSSSSEAATGPVDVVSFFSIVDFPEGSSAIYQPRFRKLFVRNTPKNVKVVESILSDLNEEAIKSRSQQVEIETKFVEFNEGALEELGFDWNMFGSGTVAGMELDARNTRPVVANSAGYDPLTGTWTSGGVVDPGTGQLIYNDNNNRPGQNVFGSYQRNNTSAFAEVQAGILASMGGTPAAMLLSNGDIDLQITAMEQEGTADVMSAPKVTTKSGNEATIRIAETHRYPQDYDVETGQRTPPVVKPQDWDDYDLGVSLKVTPVVDPESNTIDLDLQPEVIKHLGYDEYIVGFNAYDAGGNDSPKGGGNAAPLLARMPYFEHRSVQTQVTISDGSTVVMGGMIDERTETFRDQVPFLGDIPYLGRLFRSEGSRSSKKNLVIFVTANLVDGRGMTHAQRELAQQAMVE